MEGGGKGVLHQSVQVGGELASTSVCVNGAWPLVLGNSVYVVPWYPRRWYCWHR